jgi:hypothetical protein
MAILNITYGGRSADVESPVHDSISDDEVVRIAVEVLRAGELAGMSPRRLTPDAFGHFVVDRLPGAGGVLRIYLRPKVPFGC